MDVTNPVELGKFNAAAARFRAFFNEIGQTFIEREEAIKQLGMALLAREHVLLTGAPGTAKSSLAAAVLGRIYDESTGEASLFARQYTESTVQTDIVGPINFKTLMETGRTQHFTDEGMLGATHAFLDEVFDGRDNLLRSTLNLLHERELKQGTSITKGKIECAVMTSNRYVAEILDSSRMTLLAFLDRIAFVCFLPRGFTNPENTVEVVRRQVGPLSGSHHLRETLTVQDLDILQSAVDATWLPDVICKRLVTLIDDMDTELTEAARNDPAFQPTRYFSTRTAVRSARVLRANAVWEIIMTEREPHFEVNITDLTGLGHHLVLGGLTVKAATQRLKLESDPRERRQLQILRTEREIFERCVTRLPPVKDSAPNDHAIKELVRRVEIARNMGDPEELAKVTQLLVDSTGPGDIDTETSRQLLSGVVGQLSQQAFLEGLLWPDDADLVASGRRLEALGSDLEEVDSAYLPLANWLRARALEHLETALSRYRTADATLCALIDTPSPSVDAISEEVDRRIRQLEYLHSLRIELSKSSPASGSPRTASWEHTLSQVAYDIKLLWSAAFRKAIANDLVNATAGTTELLLSHLKAAVDNLGSAHERIKRLGSDYPLTQEVVGPRLAAIIGKHLNKSSANRNRCFEILENLDETGLLALAETQSLFDTFVSHLMLSHELDAREPTLPFSLLELAVRSIPKHVRATTQPDDVQKQIEQLFAELDPTLTQTLIEAQIHDLKVQIEALETVEKPTTVDQLAARVSKSVHDQGIRVLRRRIDCLSMFFSEHRQTCESLQDRLTAVAQDSCGDLVAELEAQEDAAWKTLLDSSS